MARALASPHNSSEFLFHHPPTMMSPYVQVFGRRE
jgi:hypothetical protein